MPERVDGQNPHVIFRTGNADGQLTERNGPRCPSRNTAAPTRASMNWSFFFARSAAWRTIRCAQATPCRASSSAIQALTAPPRWRSRAGSTPTAGTTTSSTSTTDVESRRASDGWRRSRARWIVAKPPSSSSRRRGATPSTASQSFRSQEAWQTHLRRHRRPHPPSQLPEQMTAEWQVCDLTDARDPVSFNVARLPVVQETVVRFSSAALQALAHGLRRAGLDAGSFVWPPEGEPDRSPYPGLRALEEADAAVFFGREASIVRAIDQLRLVRERDVERLFVILGASGAGKSSFLRAGLLPRIRRDSEHFIVLPPIRPERAAVSGSQGLLNSLKGALAAAGHPMSPAQIRGELSSLGLAGILDRIGSTMQRENRSPGLADRTMIVPIDQAEELFGSDGQDEAQQFLTCVDELRTQLTHSRAPATGGRRLRVLFVLTIRSDSLPRLQAQTALQALSPCCSACPPCRRRSSRRSSKARRKRHPANRQAPDHRASAHRATGGRCPGRRCASAAGIDIGMVVSRVHDCPGDPDRNTTNTRGSVACAV